MHINLLVSAVNSVRAREDYVYFMSEDFQRGNPPSSKINFIFDGQKFQTEIPYRIRFTRGVIIQELNSNCYLITEEGLKKVTFGITESDEVFWSV